MKINAVPKQEHLKEILGYNPETGAFTWKWRNDISVFQNRRWANKKAGTKNRKGIKIWTNDGQYAAHRIAWVYVYGDGLSLDMQVDHANGDPFDNRIENLRLATHGQNCTNCKARNRDLPKGVYKYNKSGMFRAAIGVNKKVLELGIFLNIQEAHAAYMKAAKIYKGEFARAS